MNDDERTFEAMRAWQVETSDLTGRVNAAIDTTPDLVAELRAMRQELSALRTETVRMHEELALLRAELSRGANQRLSPFFATESLVRLS